MCVCGGAGGVGDDGVSAVFVASVMAAEVTARVICP